MTGRPPGPTGPPRRDDSAEIEALERVRRTAERYHRIQHRRDMAYADLLAAIREAAASEPQVSQKTLATLCGFSPQRIRQIVSGPTSKRDRGPPAGRTLPPKTVTAIPLLSGLSAAQVSVPSSAWIQSRAGADELQSGA